MSIENLSVKKLRVIVLYVILVMLLNVGSIFYSYEHNFSDMPAGSRHAIHFEDPTIAQKKVFKVTKAFSDYSYGAHKLLLSDPFEYKTGKEVKSERQMKALTEKRVKHYEYARKHLRSVLVQSMSAYPDQLQQHMELFIRWLDLMPATRFTQLSIKNGERKTFGITTWTNDYKRYTAPIFSDLRQLNGFADIDSPKDADVMLAVPKAKQALINHQNDPELCTVMQHWNDRNSFNNKGRQYLAQQIAFFQLGDHFCDLYYHLPSTWGPLYEGDKSYPKSSNPYNKLSYAAYYRQELSPRLPGAIKAAERKLNGPDRYQICGVNPDRGYTSPRNPKVDAERLAHKIVYQRNCRRSAELPSFLNTPLLCLMRAKIMCDSDHKCDTIQRCIKQTKPIFSEKK